MGNRMSFEDRMRESKRKINRAVRELDRERVRLQNQEKKTISEIKKLARAN
jgi:charged multivesicular body protein 2A